MFNVSYSKVLMASVPHGSILSTLMLYARPLRRLGLSFRTKICLATRILQHKPAFHLPVYGKVFYVICAQLFLVIQFYCENYFAQVVLRETDQISGIKDYLRNIWDRLQTWLLTVKNKFKRIDYPHPPMKLQIDLLISRGLEVN